MTYATRQDLIDRFGAAELDDLSPIDDDRTPSVLADADAEIDAMLAAAYDLPLVGTYPVLTAIACDIARLRLYDDAVPAEAVLARATRSRARLKEIVEGVGALVDADGDIVARRIESGPPLGAKTNVDSTSARMTRKRLEDF